MVGSSRLRQPARPKECARLENALEVLLSVPMYGVVVVANSTLSVARFTKQMGLHEDSWSLTLLLRIHRHYL